MIKKLKHYLVATAAAGSLACGSIALAQDVSIGTMSQGTSGYSMGSAIARVLAENGIQARVQPAAGTSAYLPLLSMGELDFGIANAIEVREAVTGAGGFKGRELGNLRAVGVFFPFRTALFVRDDSGINSIADLKGKSVAHGYTSQAVVADMVNALLATGGLTQADVKTVMVPNVIRGADAFTSGRADAALFAIGSGKVSEVDAAVGGLHFVPISDRPDAVAAMKKLIPEAYVGTVNPAPGIAGVDAPLKAMMYDYVLLAGDHVPDDVVERAVKILHDNKDQLAASFAPFKAFQPSEMAKQVAAEYHDGAVAAYKDLGLWPPKQP